jgi:hypothetical protein
MLHGYMWSDASVVTLSSTEQVNCMLCTAVGPNLQKWIVMNLWNQTF